MQKLRHSKFCGHELAHASDILMKILNMIGRMSFLIRNTAFIILARMNHAVKPLPECAIDVTEM